VSIQHALFKVLKVKIMSRKFIFKLHVYQDQEIEITLNESQIDEVKELIMNNRIEEEEDLFDHLLRNRGNYDYEYGYVSDIREVDLDYLDSDYFEQLKSEIEGNK